MRYRIALFLIAAVAAASPAHAQSVEGRVDRLEREMRAVQRKVFPGGTGLVQPDITAPSAPTVAPGTPAASAVVDLTARVSALESQLSTMTGQIEQSQYRIRQLEEQFAEYRRSIDAKLAAPPAQPAPFETDPAEPPPSEPAPTTDAVEPTAAAAATPTMGSAAVERPDTGDAAEDQYVYGYRLWNARAYPQAIAELKKVVASHPDHRRASFAQNLIGRAYLDDGKPSLASIAFYDNYKKMPDGERAPDSLLYLGRALVQLKKPADACKVYAELEDVYADRVSASMSADIAAGRTAAKCK